MPDKKMRHQTPIKVSSPEQITRVNRVVEKMIAVPPSHTDPNGSYTGHPVVRDEVPVQDADDL